MAASAGGTSHCLDAEGLKHSGEEGSIFAGADQSGEDPGWPGEACALAIKKHGERQAVVPDAEDSGVLVIIPGGETSWGPADAKGESQRTFENEDQAGGELLVPFW